MRTPKMPVHIRAITEYFQRRPIQAPPPPWQHITTIAVGGLLAVGYGFQSDQLLVLSTQGRSICDCRSGALIARDTRDASPFFDAYTLIATGFDVLETQSIPIAGLFGGGLAHGTRDHWHLQAIPLPWPQWSIVLEYPARSIYTDATNGVRVGEDGACELRTYGFSPTGQSFIIATSCDLVVFARE